MRTTHRSRPFAAALSAVAMLAWSCATAPAANILQNPPYTVDEVLLLEGAAALLRGAQADGIEATPDGGGIQLAAGRGAGSLTLAPVQTDFEFNELIPSWNGWAPPDGGFRVLMRAGSGRSATPWFEAGTWGDVGGAPQSRVARFPGGCYDVDYLLLDKPAQTVELRIDLVRAAPGSPSPVIRLVALNYTNSLGNRRLWQKSPYSAVQGHGTAGDHPATRTLSIPYRSQVVERKQWIGRICSPASVSMAAAHFGRPESTQEIATQLYDPASDLFGVWHRSVQGAAQAGLRGYVRRYRNWEDVRRDVDRGHVICASIRFNLGDLADPPRVYRKRGTEGHIVVVKGFAPGRRVVTHDSASKDHGPNETWREDDLAKAWFDKGGVAYVFTGRAAKAPAAQPPAAR
jgi:hypothetical protein